MTNELEWVRWQLDRLGWARLTGPLGADLEARYERLVRREAVLLQADNRLAS